MRVAWFSVLNTDKAKPSGSASAYFTDQVLPALSSQFEVELFHDSHSILAGYPTFHYLMAWRRHRLKPFDAFFYQIEDLEQANFSRIHAGLVPGVTLFHDFALAHDLPECLHNSPWKSVVDRFIKGSHVAWPTRNLDYPQEIPLAVREASMSLLPLFTSERNVIEYGRNVSSRLIASATAAVTQIPHAMCLPYPVDFEFLASCDNPDTLADSSSPLRIGFCGSPRIEHRAHKLLHALSQLECSYRLVWLIDENECGEARALAQEYRISDIEFVSQRSPYRWKQLVRSLDVAVHLLFSAFGQTGPYLQISMARGLPCIVTNFGAEQGLPESVVFKTTPGDREAVEILETLRFVSKELPLHQLANRTREFSREFFERSTVTREFESLFSVYARYLRNMLREWEQFEQSAVQSCVGESRACFEKRLDSTGDSWWQSGSVLWETTVKSELQELGLINA